MNNIKRMCIVTREVVEVEKLIRFALLSDRVLIDEDKTIKSRGAYIKNDKEVINELIQKKRINCKMSIEQKRQIIELVESMADEQSI